MRRRTGALGQAGGVELPLVTRPPALASSATVVGLMQRAAWAALRRCGPCPGRDYAHRYRVPQNNTLGVPGIFGMGSQMSIRHGNRPALGGV